MILQRCVHHRKPQTRSCAWHECWMSRRSRGATVRWTLRSTAGCSLIPDRVHDTARRAPNRFKEHSMNPRSTALYFRTGLATAVLASTALLGCMDAADPADPTTDDTI